MRVFVDHLSQEGGTHILPVAPHLVGVAPLVPPAASSTYESGITDDIGLVEVLESTSDVADSPFGIRNGLAVGILAVCPFSKGTEREIHLGSIHVVLTLAHKRSCIIATVGIVLN